MMDAVSEQHVEPPSGAADEQPFAHDGGPVGVVLSHGFTGTPASMRPWADHLAAAGYTVRLPLLPGHGGTWQDANRTRWPQWYAAVEQAYDEVAARCEVVFAAGLSMGGTLVTRLAEQKGSAIAGLVLVNPSFGTKNSTEKLAPYISWLVRSRPSIGGDIKKPGVEEPANDRTPVVAGASLVRMWKVVVSDLDRVTAPVRLYRSVEDHVVDDLSATLLKTRATSTEVEEILLENSYHVATLDYDADEIFAGSVKFFEQLTAEQAT
jgi:carboxylesterase